MANAEQKGGFREAVRRVGETGTNVVGLIALLPPLLALVTNSPDGVKVLTTLLSLVALTADCLIGLGFEGKEGNPTRRNIQAPESLEAQL